MQDNTPTILIVDDEKSNIDILLVLFEKMQKDVNVVASLSGEKALKIVEKRKIDLILLDIMMPGMNGYETCEILKSQEHTKDIPILFITASTDDKSIKKAYDIGAADYVKKPFRVVELLARVKLNLKLRQTIEELDHLASYDVMTGIYNRRKFFELAKSLYNKDNKNTYAVMVDIDKFKNINDTYGHAFGDVVIKLLATAVKEHLPKEFVFGRIGGEEFAIIGVMGSMQEITELMEKIRKIAEELKPENDERTVVTFTISTGIAEKSQTTKSLDTLLQLADDALYEAKETGRNRVIFRS